MQPRQKITGETPDMGAPLTAKPVYGDPALAAREQESREYVYTPPGQLPATLEHTDYTFRWLRFRLQGDTADPKNISKHRADGYHPVPYANAAEALVDPESVMASASGNIEVGDLMLARRPRWKTTARARYYDNRVAAEIRAVSQHAKGLVDPQYSGNISDNTSHHFGRDRNVSFQD